MAINKKMSKKKILVYSVLMLVMLLGNIFIYMNNSASGPSQETVDELAATSVYNQPAVTSGTSGVAVPKTSAANRQIKEIIGNQLFLTLQKIGDWPIEPKHVGKNDPFAPFFNQP
jgi:tetrahydromethanopterin S-methyltransferase subunit D